MSPFLLLLAQESEPVKVLPEPVRQIALMAILGIALLGMFMIISTMLGGHWVRRLGNRLRRPAVPPDVISKQRLAAKLPKKSPKNKSAPNLNNGETLSGDDTIVS